MILIYSSNLVHKGRTTETAISPFQLEWSIANHLSFVFYGQVTSLSSTHGKILHLLLCRLEGRQANPSLISFTSSVKLLWKFKSRSLFSQLL